MELPEAMGPSFAAAVAAQLAKARKKHRPIHSLHEGYAVILEELDAFKAEVFKQERTRSPYDTLCELIQVAAMCQRVAEDMYLIGGDVPSHPLADERIEELAHEVDEADYRMGDKEKGRTVQVEGASNSAKDYAAWRETWDLDMCLSEIEMMVTRVRRKHNEQNAAHYKEVASLRARLDACEPLVQAAKRAK